MARVVVVTNSREAASNSVRSAPRSLDQSEPQVAGRELDPEEYFEMCPFGVSTSIAAPWVVLLDLLVVA